MIYEHNKYEANSSNINTAFSCYSGWLNAPGSGGIHPSLYGWFMAEIAMLLSQTLWWETNDSPTCWVQLSHSHSKSQTYLVPISAHLVPFGHTQTAPLFMSSPWKVIWNPGLGAY